MSAAHLPAVGEVYWVEPSLFAFGFTDPEDARPALVVRAPRDWLDRLAVVTRTSDTKAAGVPHPADRAIGCNKDGVFARKFWGWAEATRFVEPEAKLTGQLPEPYLSQVLKMWEAG